MPSGVHAGAAGRARRALPPRARPAQAGRRAARRSQPELDQIAARPARAVPAGERRAGPRGLAARTRSWSATTARGSSCCSAPSASCCSSRARTSRTCCSRGRLRASARDRHPRGGRRGPRRTSCGRRSPRACCWPRPAACWACSRPTGASRALVAHRPGRHARGSALARVDGPVLGFALLLTLRLGARSSDSRRPPAWRAQLPQDALKEGGRTGSGGPARPAARRARRGRDRARAGAADRRRAADPERHRAQRRGPRLRSRAACWSGGSRCRRRVRGARAARAGLRAHRRAAGAGARRDRRGAGLRRAVRGRRTTTA